MNQKILVIEDDPDARRIISLIIKLDGFTVLTAANGSEALMLLKDDRPDLIVLDVSMPGIDGYEVCRQVRSHHETMELPILILSARSDRASIARGYEVGANNYLRKPIGPAALNNALRELLDGKAKVTDKATDAHAPSNGEGAKH